MGGAPPIEVSPSPAREGRRTHRSARLGASDVVGTTVILAGLLVPSAVWPDLVRTSPAPPESALALGGLFFSAGLIMLGAFVIIGCRFDIWRPMAMLAPVQPAPTMRRS